MRISAADVLRFDAATLAVVGGAMDEEEGVQHLDACPGCPEGPATLCRSNEPWTPDEDELFRMLVEEGKTARTISTTFRRTTRAIRRRAERLNLSWRKARDKTTMMTNSISPARLIET
ncbi:MAG: hypothetical protein J0H42_00070 [Rhizobiales bacterium]|nr:hypothetical protein [Hyphomicrobiales bacterium]